MGRSRPERDGRRDGDQPTILGSNQLPSTFMDHPMVTMAEQDLVVDLASAAEQPVDKVVAVAIRGGALATRPLAMPVACDQGLPPRSFDRPLGAADVEHAGALPVAPGQAGIARPSLH